MFYTVYRVVNLSNGKEYLGKHQTDNLEDGYMGSGKNIKRAIQKYGIENFKKEILHVFETEDEMNAKEAELVTEEYCDRKDTYNICSGGKGGFSYINKNRLCLTENHEKSRLLNLNKANEKYKELCKTKEFREKLSETQRKIKQDIWKIKKHPWIGKEHKEESKRKMSETHSRINKTGAKNPSFGTMWITNGTENKKIKKELDKIPEGWYKGRVIKKEHGNG